MKLATYPVSNQRTLNDDLLFNKIEEFEFIESRPKKSSFRNFSLGTYKIKSTGEKVHSKTARKNTVAINNALQYESRLFNTLYATQEKLRKKGAKQAEGVYIPRPYGLYLKNNKASLFIEFVEGKKLSDIPFTQQKQHYQKSIQYIRLLGANIPKTLRKDLKKRQSWKEVAMYPPLVLLAIIANPKNTSIILNGVKVFFLDAIHYLREQKTVLTHRDLHSKNILVNKNNAYIIDVENMAYTHPEYEYVVSFIATWRQPKLAAYLWSFIKDKRVGRLLVIKTTTHYLIHKKLPKHKKEDYENALIWATNLKI